jgi:hypothetical protein
MDFTFPGSPSSPDLAVVRGGDLVSFDFTITPSSPPDCFVNYIITATSGGVSRDITVPAGQVDGSTPVNVDGFNVCNICYIFTVAPVTIDGQAGPRSDSVEVKALNPGIQCSITARSYNLLPRF